VFEWPLNALWNENLRLALIFKNEVQNHF